MKLSKKHHIMNKANPIKLTNTQRAFCHDSILVSFIPVGTAGCVRPCDRLIFVSLSCFPISVGAGLVSIEGMNVLIKSHPDIGFNYFCKIFHTQAFRSTASIPKCRIHPVSSWLLGAYRHSEVPHPSVRFLLRYLRHIGKRTSEM